MSVFGVSTAFGSGIVIGAASILSVGPTNMMLMREGLRRGHVATLATTVWTTDLILIAVAYGIADEIDLVPPVLRLLLSWMGLGALGLFSLLALLAATKGSAGSALTIRVRESRTDCIRRALTVVWCNPLTYLERLLVPASFCATFPAASSRAEFAGADLIMAGLCCYGYAYGGSAFASLMRHERATRAFDAASGLLLAGAALVMGVRLARATF